MAALVITGLHEQLWCWHPMREYRTTSSEGDVNLPASLEAKNYVEPGWEAAQAGLPTFTTSRPSTTPHRRPAGFKQCQPHELDRWKKDLHRYPPYQYRDENCLRSTKKDFRPPSVAEREAILGFVKGLCPGQFPTLQGLQLRPPVMEYHHCWLQRSAGAKVVWPGFA